MNSTTTDFYKLVNEYLAWVEQHTLPEMDAEELVCATDENAEYITTPEEREWLEDFNIRWDAMMDE